MGCSASGARDIGNFEHNLSLGRLPTPDSIQYEGSYYKFMFETGEELEKLFAPAFSISSSKDPISGKREYFLCMGMNSKLDGDGLQRNGGRPNINLSIVLDVSGSMDCSFGEGDNLTKIDVAKTSLISGLLPQLTPKDYLSIATFTETAHIVQPIQPLPSVDMATLKTKVSALSPGGGTALLAGMNAAAQQLKSVAGNENESRVFYFTDMDPGTSPRDCDQLFALTETLAEKHSIFVTFIGIGVDFNSAVVKRIAAIKGCSYLCVRSSRDFKKMMDEEFKFFVTIAAQDVKVQLRNLQTSGWEVEEVFGSPGNEHPVDGVLCQVNSIFPSPKASRTETKGGVVIIKLRPTSDSPQQELIAVTTYHDKNGHEFTDKQVIALPSLTEDSFGGSAVRKGVLLTRYVKFVKRMLEDAQSGGVPSLDDTTGLFGAPLPKKKETAPPAKLRHGGLDDSYLPLYDKVAKWFAAESELQNDTLLLDLQKHLEELRKAAFP